MVKLHYVEAGNGTPAVLLHGWPQTLHAWRHVMPILAERYRTIAIDLRGLGESEAPATGYDKATLARDVHELLTSLDIHRADIVGHDLGAAVAWAYANLFPESVAHLCVMEDPLPGLGDWESIAASRWHFAFHAQKDLPEALVAGREQTYLHSFFKNAHVQGAVDEAAYVAAYSRPASLHAGFEYYRAFPADAEWNRAHVAKLPVPTLALGGEHSPYKTTMHEQLEGHVEWLVGEVVPGCGHFVPEEQPRWLAHRLLEWFST